MKIKTRTRSSGTDRSSRNRDSDRLPVQRLGEADEFRSYLFWGRAGSGKTTLASSFPKPILYLDIKDRGTDSIADVKDIDLLRVPDVEMFERAYWELHENPEGYKTVVIDTVSQLQDIVIQHFQGDKKQKNGKVAGDWGSMTKQDWGKVSGYMKKWLVDFRDLEEMNVVFLAQDRVFNVDEEEDGGDILMPEVGPRLMPSVASTLNAAVSVIGNPFVRNQVIKGKDRDNRITRKEKTEYCLRIGPNPVYLTKIRKPKHIEPPSFIVDPSYDKIMDIIEGEE